MNKKMVGRVAGAYEAFGFDLLAQLVDSEADSNVLISPLSIAIALAMTYNGAKAQTAQALANVLGISDIPLEQVNAANRKLLSKLEQQGDKVQLTLANSLWTKDGIALDDAFVQRLKTVYASEVGTFDNAKTINRWVSNATQGKIKELVSDGMLASMIVTVLNAIYFKGAWAYPFQALHTKERDFTLVDGTTRPHPIMSRTGRYRYCESDHFQAVCVPYANERTSLYVFLPRESVSLQSFFTQIIAENWQRWLTQFSSIEVSLKLPRFKAAYSVQLKETLIALGLDSAFLPEADFGGMGAGNLVISDVIHKAVIEVNEEGSEAAAATAVMMVRSRPRQVSIEVNRPFFYAIRDDSLGLNLFTGVVMDPSVSD